jgi:hypothetical protein
LRKSLENSRLSNLAAQLADGPIVDDDARLAGILQSLTVVCRLSLENISRLTGLDVEDLERALNDPQELPPEKKYQLAIRSFFLINAVNNSARAN